MRNSKQIWMLGLLLSLALIPSVNASDDHHHDHHEHEEAVIKLSEESQTLGGIVTQKIQPSEAVETISVSGRIAQDAEDVKYVFAPVSASVKELRGNLGSNVKEGDLLGLVRDDHGNPLEIKSPMTGTIIAQFTRKGDHVDRTTAIYAIADLTQLWANFDVYEKDVSVVQLGQKMNIYPLSYPDRSFEGEIVFISPRVEESTYTIKIRARVNNSTYLLKLGMSVRGEIIIKSDGSSLVLPSESVQTLEGKTVVFKKTQEGFEAVEVTIKSRTKESVVITEGIEEGDDIVTEGSFILKSKMLEGEMVHEH